MAFGSIGGWIRKRPRRHWALRGNREAFRHNGVRFVIAHPTFEQAALKSLACGIRKYCHNGFAALRLVARDALPALFAFQPKQHSEAKNSFVRDKGVFAKLLLMRLVGEAGNNKRKSSAVIT